MERRCVPTHRSCSPAHLQTCQEYWAAREADVRAMEQATAMYRAEIEEWKRNHRLITFKQFLIGRRQQPASECAA